MTIFLWSSLALLCTVCRSLKYKGELDLVPNIAGNAQNNVEVEIDYDDDEVEIKFTVNNGGVWNGIGFGSQVMNGTYAIILDYDSEVGEPTVQEWSLGDHNPGELIFNSVEQDFIEVIEDAFVDPNGRSVTIKRRVAGASGFGVYEFPSEPADGSPIEIPMIAAVGPSWEFFLGGNNRHSQFNREAVTLVLLPVTNETSTIPPSSTSASDEACCDCLETSDSGGCRNAADCENLVCNKDRYCCNGAWDSICVQQASAYCEGTEQPLCCACTVGQGGQPGCPADADCESTICAQDPYCCGVDGNGYWDKACVNQAYALCSPQ